ncbi:hypothetical protein Peur_026612 [Populus x canadensis]
MYNHHQNLTQPTMPPPTIALKPVIHLYFERFPSWLDRQTLRKTFIKYGEAVSGGSKTKGQNNKPPVHHIPVPVKQQGLRSYAMVV